MVILLLIAAETWAVLIDRYETEQRAYAAAAALADGTASAAGRDFGLVAVALDELALALDRDVDQAAGRPLQLEIAASQGSFILAVGLATPDGRIVASGQAPGENEAAAGELAMRLANGLPQPGRFGQSAPLWIGAPQRTALVGPQDRFTVLVVRVRPILGQPEGNVHAVALVSLDGLQGFGEGLNLQADQAVSLIGADGFLLVRVPRDTAVIGRPVVPESRVAALSLPGVLAPRGETVLTSPIDGVERFMAWRQVAPFDLYAVGGVRRADVLIPWRVRLATSVVVTMVVGLAVILLTIRLRREIRDRLAAQAKAIERLTALAEASHSLGTVPDRKALSQRAAMLLEKLVPCSQATVRFAADGLDPPVVATSTERPVAGKRDRPEAPVTIPIPTELGGDAGLIELHGFEAAGGTDADRLVVVQFAQVLGLNFSGVRLLANLARLAQRAGEDRDRALADKSYITAVLDAFLEGFASFDTDDRLVTCNPAFARLAGRPPAELRGRTPEEVFPGTDPIRLRAATATGLEASSPDPIVVQDAATGRWLELRFGRLPDGFALYVRDSTRQREAEASLREASRLEAIGQLAAGVAHDFNNLLTVILGNAEILSQLLPEDSPARRRAAQIERASEQAAELTSRLLAFSLRERVPAQPVDLGQLLADLGPLLRSAAGERVVVAVDVAADAWPALLDPNELRNAILNLVINARDAMPEGGRVTITVANHVVAAEDASDLPPPGDHVLVAVADTGHGMTEDVRRRAFEPFFTTKQGGRGTGHGLAIVYGFVRQSAGHVDLQSAPGQGTVVRMFLPRAVASIECENAQPAKEIPLGAGELVLLIEDQRDVREQIREMIEKLGYKVAAADSGPAALRLVAAGLRPAAVVSDVMLPDGPSGLEAVEALRQVLPGLPALMMSGHVESRLMEHAATDLPGELLMKPFRRHELARRLRALLPVSAG